MIFKRIQIHYLVRLIIFWLLYSALFRILFIVYHHTKILDGQHSETGLSFFYGFRLDLSTACIAIMIPFILWAVQQYHKTRLVHLINLAYNCSLIILVSALSIINMKVYGEWDTLLGYRALKYLLFPDEMHKFLSLWSMMLLLFVITIFAYIGIRRYRKHMTNFSYPIENKNIRMALLFIIPIVMLIGFRGGLQSSPINETNSDYSNLQINNSIATNNIWYFVHTVWDERQDKDFNAQQNPSTANPEK